MQLELESSLYTYAVWDAQSVYDSFKQMVSDLGNYVTFTNIVDTIVITDNGTSSCTITGDYKVYIDTATYLRFVPAWGTNSGSSRSIGMYFDLYSNAIGRNVTSVGVPAYYGTPTTYMKYRIYTMPTGDTVLLIDCQRNATYVQMLDTNSLYLVFGSATHLISGQSVPAVFCNHSISCNCDSATDHNHADLYAYRILSKYTPTTETMSMSGTYVSSTVFAPLVDARSSVMMNSMLGSVYRCNTLNSDITPVTYDSKNWIRIGRFLILDQEIVQD